MVNNPTECAVFEAHHFYPHRDIECILSIGTGVPRIETGSENVYRLVREFVSIATNSRITDERVRAWIELTARPPAYFRFSPGNGVGSVSLDCTDAQILEEGERTTRQYMEEEMATEMQRLKALLHPSGGQESG